MGEISKIKRVKSVQEALFNISTFIKEHDKYENKKQESSNNSLFDQMFQSELKKLSEES